MPQSAYIHIPFCRRRCYYCDFAITPIGDRALPENSPMIAEYTDHLLQEIRHFAPPHPRTGEHPTPSSSPFPSSLKTLFFGGGTPSLLPTNQLDRILHTLEIHYGFAPDIEISMEIDPGTFDLPRLRTWKALGINRYSLGIQSIHDSHLETLGRSHRHTDNLQAIDHLHAANLTNFSLDLISGIPGLTFEQWDHSLTWAIATDATHLSTYDLTIEPGTVFGKQYDKGQLKDLPPEETTAQMYRHASTRLAAAGYPHYEISNHAKPGYESQHNLTYWRTQPFYGFGMGATSFLNDHRLNRPRTREAYYLWLHTLSPHSRTGELPAPSPLPNSPPADDRPDPSPADRLLETLMMGLRLQEGISLATLSSEYSPTLITQVLNILHRYQKQGWTDISTDRIRLTCPEGFLFSNIILIALFEALDL